MFRVVRFIPQGFGDTLLWTLPIVGSTRFDHPGS